MLSASSFSAQRVLLDQGSNSDGMCQSVKIMKIDLCFAPIFDFKQRWHTNFDYGPFDRTADSPRFSKISECSAYLEHAMMESIVY